MQPQDYKKLFGLIGYPLSHSFSKRYFAEKFAKEGIKDCFYELFPISNIQELPRLINKFPNLQGLNVTIPYKEAVFPFLDDIDEGAQAVGAVNTIKIQEGKLLGFNTDVYGFEVSLTDPSFLAPRPSPLKALILGTGGAAKAVTFVLKKLNIPYLTVSRSAEKGDITYEEMEGSMMSAYRLIINTTPLGMSPKEDTFPPIPYANLGKDHLLYDLVYNPKVTTFLKKGQAQGSLIQNGLEMLYLQAEKAWEIWTNQSPAKTEGK